jgi:hypothetical protein
MRSLLASLLIFGLLVAGTVVSVGVRAGSLPDWYLEARAAGALEPDLEAAARRAEQSLIGRFGRELLDEVTADDGTPDESFLDRLKRRGKMVLEGLREGREVRLDARDLQNTLLAMAIKTDDGRELLAAAQAVRAEISGQRLELGAVVMPARLPADRLSANQRRLLDLLLRLSGSDGEVYVALCSTPGVAEGHLLLGPPLSLRVGDLELSSTLLAALGADAPELESGLVLDVGRMTVRQATIEDDTLVLIVSPQI